MSGDTSWNVLRFVCGPGYGVLSWCMFCQHLKWTCSVGWCMSVGNSVGWWYCQVLMSLLIFYQVVLPVVERVVLKFPTVIVGCLCLLSVLSIWAAHILRFCHLVHTQLGFWSLFGGLTLYHYVMSLSVPSNFLGPEVYSIWHSDVSLYLLIGVFRPSPLTIIIDMLGLKSAIFILFSVFFFLCFFFLPASRLLEYFLRMPFWFICSIFECISSYSF